MDSSEDLEQGSALAERHAQVLEELNGVPVKISPDEARVAELSSRSLGATDWQGERPISTADRPVPGLPGSGTDAVAAVDRLSRLVLHETALARQSTVDSMAVVLRPDSQTELFVHLTHQNGQVQATVRCERGDFTQLNALWPQLQHTLAQQKVSLAPLQESSRGQTNLTPPSGRDLSWTNGGGTDRRPAPEDQSLAERPTPATAGPDSTAERDPHGSRQRLTTSRPGWETWA